MESEDLLHEVIGSGPLFQARLTEVEMRITHIHMYTYMPPGEKDGQKQYAVKDIKNKHTNTGALRSEDRAYGTGRER